jgi:hypothetical protein
MMPSQVPDEIAEAASRARIAAQRGDGSVLEDFEWAALRSDIEVTWMHVALAAVWDDVVKAANSPRPPETSGLP